MKLKSFLVLLAAIGLTHGISFAQRAENQNPYAIFGSKPYVAGAEQNKEQVKVFVIENIAAGSDVARLEHNTETGVVTYFDKEGNAIRQKKLRKGERAWPTQDRFAEKYYHLSPYSYAAGNPIRNIDINGDSIRVYTETAGFGHAWISTGEGDNMTVYSYGRYDGTNKGPNGSSNSAANGPGVLLRLPGSKGQEYNNQKASTTGMNVYVITDVADEAVSNILDNMFYSTENMPSNPNSSYYLSPFAHVIDEYKLTSNNCTTVVSDALNQSGSKALYAPVIGGMIPTAVPNMAPRPQTFIMPQALGTHLNGISRPGGMAYRGR